MKPLVGILCSTEQINIPNFPTLTHQAVFQKYVNAVADYANCLPILIPTSWTKLDSIGTVSLEIINHLNGVLLPGGSSNVAVELYSNAIVHKGPRDLDRDAFAISIIHAAVQTGIPLLGICRGMQEINVALGGSLITAIHEHAGKKDHRSNISLPFEERYKPSHAIHLVENSWIQKALSILPGSKVLVNSLHGQGINKIGEGLIVDAYCEDGTIEAISHIQTNVNIIGVQWHPEWNAEECKVSMSIWQRFGNNCRTNLAKK